MSSKRSLRKGRMPVLRYGHDLEGPFQARVGEMKRVLFVRNGLGDLEVNVHDLQEGTSASIEPGLKLHASSPLCCRWNELQPVSCCVVLLQPRLGHSISC